MKTEHMCSIAFKDRHTQELKVAAGSSVAVPYTIVPLAVGKLPVEVMVVGRGLTGEDRIQKLLRVVVSSRTIRPGGRTKFYRNFDLCYQIEHLSYMIIKSLLSGDQMDGVQKTEVWSAVLNPTAEGGKDASVELH